MTTDPFDSRPAIVKMSESLDDPVEPECDEDTNRMDNRSAIVEMAENLDDPVGPECDEYNDKMDNRATIVKTPDSLYVPEEPECDDETTFRYEVGSALNRTSSEGSTKSISFSAMVTAINVAKWMARAYGYSSRNKSLFVSQDKVCSIFFCSHGFP